VKLRRAADFDRRIDHIKAWLTEAAEAKDE
jgi:hypothetical protein